MDQGNPKRVAWKRNQCVEALIEAELQAHHAKNLLENLRNFQNKFSEVLIPQQMGGVRHVVLLQDAEIQTEKIVILLESTQTALMGHLKRLENGIYEDIDL